MDPWIYIVWYGSVFSPLIPLLFFSKNFNYYQKVIVVFILLSFLTDLYTTFLHNGNNFTILHIYGLIDAVILFWFYSIVIDNSKKQIVIVALVFITVYTANSVLLESEVFNTIGRSLQSIIFLILSLILFYQFYQKEEDFFLERSPLFWINVALMVYFGGAFFSFLLSKIMSINLLSWIFHNACNILKNIILGIGLWRAKTS